MIKWKSPSGHIVRWAPSDAETAAAVVEEIVGKMGAEVAPETAQQVMDEYERRQDNA